MATFKMRLFRPTKHVMLEMTDGVLLQKGTWKRLPAESNSALASESGLWENSALQGPGGASNTRLYDPSDTKSALLKGTVGPNTTGEGDILVPDFGGAFGDDSYKWVRF